MSQQPEDLSGAPFDEDGEGALPLIELETLLSQPPSWRRRFTQLALLLAALLVILAAYWGLNRPATSSAPMIVFQPTQPPPTLHVVSNVDYGTLTINGQPQRAAPPLTFRLHSQPPYSITLDAPPFSPLTCQYPPLATIAPYVFHPCNAGQIFAVNQQASSTLEMLLTLADLPAAQQPRIDTLLASALTTQQTLAAPAQSVIAAGLNQDGTVRAQQVNETLSASVFLVPSTQLSRRGNFCLRFTCVGADVFFTGANASVPSWQVLTPIALRWRFTTPGGQVVSDVTFPASATPLTLALAYQPTTGWRLASPAASPSNLSAQLSQLVCDTGSQMLTRVQQHNLSGDGWTVTILHDQGVAGCELALMQGAADQGHFVWRFGALLAGDARAHATLPTLPLAAPAELAAVGG
jgi:hypothetical protein